MLCVGDLGHLFTEASGSYTEGGLLDISWPPGAALVGLAACVIGDESTVGDLEQRHLIRVTFTLVSLGRICGIEALVRWQHPRRGLTAPDTFLPKWLTGSAPCSSCTDCGTPTSKSR